MGNTIKLGKQTQTKQKHSYCGLKQCFLPRTKKRSYIHILGDCRIEEHGNVVNSKMLQGNRYSIQDTQGNTLSRTGVEDPKVHALFSLPVG